MRDELLVRPQVHALTAVLPVRRTGRGGDSDLGGAGLVGDPDLSVREHRHGDDLRRVHWPTTARRGQLMVRPDQHPQDHNAVVLLDSRADGQRGPDDRSTPRAARRARRPRSSSTPPTWGSGWRCWATARTRCPARTTAPTATTRPTTPSRRRWTGSPWSAPPPRTACGRRRGRPALEPVHARRPARRGRPRGRRGPRRHRARRRPGRDRLPDYDVGAALAVPAAAPGERHEAAVARLQDSGWRVAVVEAGGSVVLAWESLERTGVMA